MKTVYCNVLIVNNLHSVLGVLYIFIFIIYIYVPTFENKDNTAVMYYMNLIVCHQFERKFYG